MFPERLKLMRKKNKLTMLQLGKKIGVGQSAIYAYEIGDRQPKLDALHNLAEILNTSSDYLLGLTDNPYPAKNSDDLASFMENNDFHYNGKKLSDKDLKLFTELLEHFVDKKEAETDKIKSEGN